MNLEEIPLDETVFIDANIFIYHFTGVSQAATEFLTRCENREVSGATSWPVILKVLHRMMMIEAVSKGLVTPGNIARKLQENPAIVQQLSAYHQQAKAIPDMGIAILPTGIDTLAISHAWRQRYGLLVNDSISLALMEQYGIHNMATADRDFLQVASIMIYTPPDLPDDY